MGSVDKNATGVVPIAADVIGGVNHQAFKMEWGPDGTATYADASNPFPVHLRDSDGTDIALGGKVGSLTESAPGTDTASSGLNGRLQRIAQRISSLITALGSPFQAGGSIGNTVFGATQSGTWLQSIIPQTSGGYTSFPLVSLASTNATVVKASAGQVYGWALGNTNASPRYLKLYNKASAPTVGTDTPTQTIIIPGNTGGAGLPSHLSR